jgi:hypothetical protein
MLVRCLENQKRVENRQKHRPQSLGLGIKITPTTTNQNHYGYL